MVASMVALKAVLRANWMAHHMAVALAAMSGLKLVAWSAETTANSMVDKMVVLKVNASAE